MGVLDYDGSYPADVAAVPDRLEVMQQDASNGEYVLLGNTFEENTSFANALGFIDGASTTFSVSERLIPSVLDKVIYLREAYEHRLKDLKKSIPDLANIRVEDVRRAQGIRTFTKEATRQLGPFPSSAYSLLEKTGLAKGATDAQVKMALVSSMPDGPAKQSSLMKLAESAANSNAGITSDKLIEMKKKYLPYLKKGSRIVAAVPFAIDGVSALQAWHANDEEKLRDALSGLSGTAASAGSEAALGSLCVVAGLGTGGLGFLGCVALAVGGGIYFGSKAESLAQEALK